MATEKAKNEMRDIARKVFNKRINNPLILDKVESTLSLKFVKFEQEILNLNARITALERAKSGK